MLQILERRLSRRMYDPSKENLIRISRYHHELYKLYNEPNTEDR
jgi:hypothetical protein